VRRTITTLRGLVQHGNSGGPMVDGRGRVVTTIFASASDSGSREGFGVPDELVQDALGKADGPVDTGPCVR
jgi:S1-C subfamily serine protease